MKLCIFFLFSALLFGQKEHFRERFIEYSGIILKCGAYADQALSLKTLIKEELETRRRPHALGYRLHQLRESTSEIGHASCGDFVATFPHLLHYAVRAGAVDEAENETAMKSNEIAKRLLANKQEIESVWRESFRLVKKRSKKMEKEVYRLDRERKKRSLELARGTINKKKQIDIPMLGQRWRQIQEVLEYSRAELDDLENILVIVPAEVFGSTYHKDVDPVALRLNMIKVVQSAPHDQKVLYERVSGKTSP